MGYYTTVGSGDAPPLGHVGGAVEAIAVSPTDPNTIYVGAAAGGVWKSTDGGVTWTPLTDTQASLSIGSIAFDPNDPTNKTLVAGAAAESNGAWRSISVFSTPSNFGGNLNGLLYSTDGGTTWSNIGSTALAGQSVVDVTARGSTIMAATFEPRIAGFSSAGFTGGLYRSTNTGTSFTLVSGAAGSGLPAGPVTSLVGDPANPARFYAAVTSTTDKTKTGVYVSSDNGATWTQIYNYASTSAALKVAAGPGGTVAIGATVNGALTNLYYSSNSGATWTTLSAPNVNLGGQAPVNFALAIDPTNTRYVYVAGDNNYYANGGMNALAVVRVDAQTNTSTSLSDIGSTAVNTGNGSFVHPDGRALVVSPNGSLLTATDGGIYARTSPLSSSGVWQNLNGNLSTMELYSVAYDSVSKRLVASAQDNGSNYQSSPGGAVYAPIGGGDGINAAVNDRTLPGLSAIYVSSQDLYVSRAIVDQNGNIVSPNTPDQPSVPVNLSSFAPGDQASFLSPLVLNNIDPTRIALGAFHVYVTQDTLSGANGVGATSVNLNLTDVGDTGSFVTSIDYGTKNNANALVVGAGYGDDPTGKVLFSSTSAAGSLNAVAGYTGLAPTSVKFDLRSDRRFFVADSLNLYGTTDQGASFTNLSGNLPANFTRPTSLAFVDNNGVDALLVGGLNSAANAGNPLVVADSSSTGVLSDWRRFGSGLPNVTVTSLSFNPVTDTLAVGTDGRGAFLLYDFTSNFSTAQVLQFGLADNNSVPDPSVLTGDRPLVKYGPGVLTITGAASYTGSTTIQGGTMLAAAAHVFSPSSPITIDAGAAVDLGGFDQTVSSLSGAGTVTNGGLSDATLTNQGASSTFSGVIQNGSTNTTGLTQNSAGNTLILTGTNTYTGATTVNAGTLEIDGSIQSSSSVTVNAGGTLTGTGLVDPPAGTTINSGGTLTPGTAGTPGTFMTITGDLTLAPGSTYAISLDPTTSTYAVVQGAANLGGTLSATFANGAYVQKQYDVLQAGAINGTFATLATTNLPATFGTQLTYGPNDVYLNLLAQLGIGAGLNTNQQNVAGAINTSFNKGGQLPQGFVNLYYLNNAGQAQALSQVSGEATTGAQTSAFNLMGDFLSLLTDPFGTGRIGAAPAPAPTPLAYADQPHVLPKNVQRAYADAIHDPAPAPRWTVWGNVSGGTDHIGGTAGVGSTSLDGHQTALTAGAEYHVSPDLRFGFALSGAGSDWSLAQGLGRGHDDAFAAGVYGVGRGEHVYVSGALAFAQNWLSEHRVALGAPLSSDVRAQQIGARLEAGYRIDTGLIGLTPYAAVQGQNLDLPSFVEKDPTGSGFGLAYQSRTASETRGELGLRFDRAVALGAGRAFTLRAKLAWGHEWGSDPRLTAAFASLPGTSFSVTGALPGRDAALTSLEADWAFKPGMVLAAKFDGAFAAHADRLGGRVELRVSW